MCKELNQSKDINLGILIGWLKAMARVNDKTNYGHHFDLGKFRKITGTQEDLRRRFFDVSEDVTLEKIEKPLPYLEDMIGKWFFGFQEKFSFQSPYLIDKHNSFSLSDDEWRKEWTNEFVSFLLQTIQPVVSWRIGLNKKKRHYANDSVDIVFETMDEEYYHLHLSVTD